MSVWKFTTAAGEAYELQGPTGATYDQAQAVFDKQLNSGGLVGLPVGGLLNAVTQSIDGLPTAPAQIGPQAVSTTQQSGGYVTLPTQPGANVATAITTSDFVNTKTGSQTIGTLSPAEIQGLIATIAASVKQSSNVVTNSKGVGTYGLTADQLQTAGLLKPGVADQVKQDPANAVIVLSSPTSWTGKQGATDINVILNDINLQTSTQQGLMENTFSQLKQAGVINGTEVSTTLGPIVNAATVYGVSNTAQVLNNTSTATANAAATAAAVGVIGFIASSSFGGSFGSINQILSGGGGALSSGTVPAIGYTNTVNRVNVNQAMKAIIGNPKIPTPYFQSSGASASNPAAAASAIQSAISALTATGLTGEQIVDVINSRSGNTDRINTYGGILITADGTPVTDSRGNPVTIGGDSPTLGSGITSADKAAMFSGAASAAPGTTNDGVPSTSTTTTTNSITNAPGGFTNVFNNAAVQKAVITSALSGSPNAAFGALATSALSALTSQPTQSATPGVSSLPAGYTTTQLQGGYNPGPVNTLSFGATVTNAINKIVDGLKISAAENPQGFKTALTLVSSIPGAGLFTGLVSALVTPTINTALATQAALANPNTVTIPGTDNLPPITITFDAAALDSFESQTENNPVPTSEQKSEDARQFAGNDPPSNDNGSYNNSLTQSNDSDGGGGP